MCTTFLYDTCNQINQKRGGSGNFFLVWNIANSMLEERVPLLHFGASFGIGGMYMFILFISYSFKIPVLDSVAGSVILYVNLSQFYFHLVQFLSDIDQARYRYSMFPFKIICKKCCNLKTFSCTDAIQHIA